MYKKSFIMCLGFISWALFTSFDIGIKTINDFSLRNVDGKYISLKDNEQAKGYIVIFTCNHCPFAKLYPSRINKLQETFAPLGVPVLAINSMDSVLYEEESFKFMQLKSSENKFTFPYLQDASQEVAKNFGAVNTPQAFVIWRDENRWVIKYKGAIDDNGESPELAKNYIAIAVNELLSNRPLSMPSTESFGCKIFYRK